MFENVTSLDLSGNNLEYISPAFFVNFTSLKKLVLSNNRLHLMEQNNSSDFRDVLFHIPALTLIDMSHNDLNSIPKTLFDNNTKLEYVLLFENKLSVFSRANNILPNLNDLHDNLIFYLDRTTILLSEKIFTESKNNTFKLNLKETCFNALVILLNSLNG